MRDQLIGKTKINECGIVNTDISSGDGFHFVCYFKKGNFKCSFDSYGLEPLIEIQKYLKSPILYSTFRIQRLDETNCGRFSLFVLYLLSKGYKFQDIILHLLNERNGESI